jgi:hypothetical protein
VGAPEQQRVDRRTRRAREDRLAVGVTLAEERRQRIGDRRLGHRAAQLAGLDERDQGRRRVLVDLDRGVLILDRGEVGVRADRRGGRDDPDPSVAARERRRRGPRPDDAEHRQVVSASVLADPDGRGRVAGDDERLDVALHEGIERLGRELEDLLVRPDAVGGAGVVTEVDRGLARRPTQDLLQHGHPADARIEHPDRPGIGHQDA